MADRADLAVVTSDNPRSEDPGAIVDAQTIVKMLMSVVSHPEWQPGFSILVDVRNVPEAWWAALNNIDPQRDVMFTRGPIDVLDHASRRFTFGSKMGIDGTRKWPEEGFDRNWPEVIEMDPDADYLTKRITERAVGFIEANKDRPFFLYVPHPIPHAPLHVSPPFMEGVPDAIKAKLKQEKRVDYGTRRNLFRQAISEIDWSVGQITRALEAAGFACGVVAATADIEPPTGQADPRRMTRLIEIFAK